MMEIQEAFKIFQITCIFPPTMYMFWFEDKEIKKQKRKKKGHHTYETKYGMNQMKKAWEEYNLSKRPGGESLEHYEGCLEEVLPITFLSLGDWPEI